jgi:hypothetical protein
MSRNRNMPTHKDIVVSQSLLIQTLSDTVRANPEQACWSCDFLYVSGKPERAHLIAVKHGGSDMPSNFLLLCRDCHEAQPDGASMDVQLMWLRSGFTAVSFESEFLKRTGIKLTDLLEILTESHGNANMPHVINRVLKRGRRMSAGRSKGNSIANTVSVFCDEFFREIELVRLRRGQGQAAV